ncbi:hypothetical protein JKP88DRAFT_272401 [Tribonema minus]|uniref:Uncharacterized protein n=1 Tax=Tribonema minus TaxID=303371 RepID=A0A835ZQA6_9STRA|nr:hypothetical protein JKP88DRAFT_272401 [Tribonema minus]
MAEAAAVAAAAAAAAMDRCRQRELRKGSHGKFFVATPEVMQLMMAHDFYQRFWRVRNDHLNDMLELNPLGLHADYRFGPGDGFESLLSEWLVWNQVPIAEIPHVGPSAFVWGTLRPQCIGDYCEVTACTKTATKVAAGQLQRALSAVEGMAAFCLSHLSAYAQLSELTQSENGVHGPQFSAKDQNSPQPHQGQAALHAAAAAAAEAARIHEEAVLLLRAELRQMRAESIAAARMQEEQAAQLSCQSAAAAAAADAASTAARTHAEEMAAMRTRLRQLRAKLTVAPRTRMQQAMPTRSRMRAQGAEAAKLRTRLRRLRTTPTAAARTRMQQPMPTRSWVAAAAAAGPTATRPQGAEAAAQQPQSTDTGDSR